MRRFLAAAMLILGLAGVGLAQQVEDSSQAEALALAGVLVSDSHFDRAAMVLAEVQPEELDQGQLHTWHKLRGRILQDQGDHAGAAEAFEQALAIELPVPRRPKNARRAVEWEAARAEAASQLGLLRLYTAQALLTATAEAVPAEQEQAARRALELLGQARPHTAEREGHWQLLARAHTVLGQWDAAWEALSEGRSRFPDEAGFMRQQIFVLIELGLSRQAVELGSEWLDSFGATPEAVLAISEALRRSAAGEAASSQLLEAQLMLEEGRLRFPGHAEIRRQLARVLMERGLPLAAAELLREAAVGEAVDYDPALALESAELYRRAGRLDRALFLNSFVPDPVDKSKQRMGILLETGDFARVVAMEERLSRLGILQDDRITYGLAYAWFRSGSPDQAEALLKRIRDPEVFRAATELREAMARCEADGGCQ